MGVLQHFAEQVFAITTISGLSTALGKRSLCSWCHRRASRQKVRAPCGDFGQAEASRAAAAFRIARRQQPAPLAGSSEKTRRHIVAKISVETFEIEVRIALSALHSRVLRRLHRGLANLWQLLVDERIAGIADLDLRKNGRNIALSVLVN